MWLVLLFLFFAGILGEDLRPGKVKIVGGIDADVSLYPYQLSLQYLGIHACGASLIDRKWVLTAAHCVGGIFTNFLSVRAGATSRQTGGEVIPVRKKFIHKQFTGRSLDYDIALLELNRTVDPDFGEPIPLPAEGVDVKEGDVGVVLGWGATNENGSMSTNLMTTEVPVINHNDCKKIMGRMVTNRMFCAGYLFGGKDTCQGDSGGPFVVNGIQMGITSWGIGCARAQIPGVYTNVAVFRSFIRQIAHV